MQTTEVRTCEQRGVKTYQVLDALVGGATSIPLIVQATGLTYRTVNALVYALEKQSRVMALSYDKQRCNQEFVVLRYEAKQHRHKSRIYTEHPATLHAAKKAKKALDSIQRLQKAFFFNHAAPSNSPAWA